MLVTRRCWSTASSTTSTQIPSTSVLRLRGTNVACASDFDFSSRRMAPATVSSDHTNNCQSSERASGGKCVCGCWCPWVSPYARIACLAGVKSHTQEAYTHDLRHYSRLTSLETMSPRCPGRYASTNPKGNRAMKPKDQMFPAVDERYQLQLREVASESYPQRRWNGSGAERHFALRAGIVDSMGDQVCKSTPTRH
jgi:hypothetical protein